ncbi:uncharacterized protein LOC127673724 [Apodemus sylvaticus]|uniref:uncharacterized protein LOC127673724 n=1 Tax=Apodemus sylvaticus TaxID=10129 RepID=UPI002243D820|nr:uncharacterized protein LOC127673724 [Apodemus sylvaticus]
MLGGGWARCVRKGGRRAQEAAEHSEQATLLSAGEAPAWPRGGRSEQDRGRRGGSAAGEGLARRLLCFSAPLGSGLHTQASALSTLHPLLLLPLPPTGSSVTSLPPRPREPAAGSEDTGGSADRGGCGIQYGGRGRAAHSESAAPASAPPGDQAARGPRPRQTIETARARAAGVAAAGAGELGPWAARVPGRGSDRCGRTEGLPVADPADERCSEKNSKIQGKRPDGGNYGVSVAASRWDGACRGGGVEVPLRTLAGIDLVPRRHRVLRSFWRRGANAAHKS